MTRDKAISKVRKLRAHAASPGVDVIECNTYLLRARVLVGAHGITEKHIKQHAQREMVTEAWRAFVGTDRAASGA